MVDKSSKLHLLFEHLINIYLVSKDAKTSYIIRDDLLQDNMLSIISAYCTHFCDCLIFIHPICKDYHIIIKDSQTSRLEEIAKFSVIRNPNKVHKGVYADINIDNLIIKKIRYKLHRGIKNKVLDKIFAYLPWKNKLNIKIFLETPKEYIVYCYKYNNVFEGAYGQEYLHDQFYSNFFIEFKTKKICYMIKTK